MPNSMHLSQPGPAVGAAELLQTLLSLESELKQDLRAHPVQPLILQKRKLRRGGGSALRSHIIRGRAGIRTCGACQCTALYLRLLGTQDAECSPSWSTYRTLCLVSFSSRRIDSPGQEWGRHSDQSQRMHSPLSAGLQLPLGSARPNPYARQLLTCWRLLGRNESTAPLAPHQQLYLTARVSCSQGHASCPSCQLSAPQPVLFH